MSLLAPDASLAEAEWAWVAGLFEGEGCIHVSAASLNVTLSLSMVDRDVVERLDALWPSPTGVRIKPKPGGGLAQWTWQVGARDRVTGFLTGIYPWLGERRRARADEAFAQLARNRGARATRTHCPQGHPLSGDNAFRDSRGQRHCRECGRATMQRTRDKRKVA